MRHVQKNTNLTSLHNCASSGSLSILRKAILELISYGHERTSSSIIESWHSSWKGRKSFEAHGFTAYQWKESPGRLSWQMCWNSTSVNVWEILCKSRPWYHADRDFEQTDRGTSIKLKWIRLCGILGRLDRHLTVPHSHLWPANFTSPTHVLDNITTWTRICNQTPSKERAPFLLNKIGAECGAVDNMVKLSEETVSHIISHLSE